MKVMYIGESNPVALISGKIYEVLAVEHNCYRIIDEEGIYEDEVFLGYLYPTDAFKIIKE